MKLKFDAHQDYQLQAIDAVVNLFATQNPEVSSFTYDMYDETRQKHLIPGVANRLDLGPDQLLENLQAVQQANNLPLSKELKSLDFTVEMETGTGKTYVYLRTIYELHKAYNFRKFVIVVPSIAIREGVLKNLQITHQHFQTLYDRVPVHFTVYDSSKVSSLRNFATSDTVEILVINIDSFSKDANIINQHRDNTAGQKPIDFIRATSPVVIVDEPQNMETDKRREAISNLNPLCTLRYSATHKNLYNQVYRLDPVKAYDLGLVKQIEVDSVVVDNANNAYVKLISIKAAKTKITATVEIDVNTDKGVQKKKVNVSPGDDLYAKSNEREVYKTGCIIEEIDAQNQYCTLSSGTTIETGAPQGGYTDEVMKFQIKKAIEEHLDKELKYHEKGIKVLTLFFIDRVANYRSYDDAGNTIPGKFSLWFEELYTELTDQGRYKSLKSGDLSEIHNGYFSQDKKGKLKDTNGETKADDDTYTLIMKDKERLLDITNPLRFIFSHSALREGWDNPNVFQICTLNETASTMKKRQEIGRGLRLSVDNTGNRVFDPTINRLTVIANEAYEDFAKSLQQEIEEECGVSFQGRVKDKSKKKTIKYRKGFQADPRFLEIWDKIKHETSYRVEFSTSDLIRNAAKVVSDLPVVKAPVIVSQKNRITSYAKAHQGELLSIKKGELKTLSFPIPDALGYIQQKTGLSRSTIYEIIKGSGRSGDIMTNPQVFMDQAAAAINTELGKLSVQGIKYHKINNTRYQMLLMDEKDYETWLNDFTYTVKSSEKTIHQNYIPLDSSVETHFAQDCETSEQVEFYFKLPGWFKIPTPIGNYNPDWAVVFHGEKKVYFVAETKSTADKEELRPHEAMKVKCSQAHYKVFDDVEYKQVTELKELV